MVNKIHYLITFIYNCIRTLLDSMQKKYTKLKKRSQVKSNKKLNQEGISLGDPKVTIALENNIHDRYYLQIDGKKSKLHTESNVILIIFIKL